MPENRKEIMRERKRRYRKRHRAVNLNYSFEKLRTIEKEASKHGMKLPKYLKTIIEKSLAHFGYIAPNPSQLQNIILDIRKVSNNINQLVRYCHIHNEVKQVDITYLQKQLIELENKIIQSIECPHEISVLLSELLSQHPEKLHFLITWLNDYKNSTDKD